MYESESHGISWFGILRKVLILLLIMILIFGFLYFLNNRSSSSKNKNDDAGVQQLSDKKQSETNKSKKKKSANESKNNSKLSKKATKKSSSKNSTKNLESASKQFENGALKYFTPSNVPKTENETKTVKLDTLVDKGILKKLESKDGKACDTNKSTVSIKRLTNNYQLTSNLVCGNQKIKKTSYVGCYNNCLNNKICRGDKTEKAVCGSSTNNTNNSTNNETNSSNSNSSTNSNNSSSNSNNTNNNGSTNNSNNNNNIGGNNSNTSTVPKTKTLYEYRKCIEQTYCSKGSLNSNNECVVTNIKNYTDMNGNTFQSSINSYFAPLKKTVCDTTWSENPSLPGWNRTGRTKQA